MVILDTILPYVEESISVIGVLVIGAGVARGTYQLLHLALGGDVSANYIRFQFGNSIVLGLEFMVAGDIIGSLIKPDYYSLGLLAIIVGIRTVLSFFLNLELESLTPEQKRELHSTGKSN